MGTITFPYKTVHYNTILHVGRHYNVAIRSAMASQITSFTIVYSTVYSGADQRKHQSSASLAFVRGIHRSPVNSPHKGPVTRKMSPFDDVIMDSAKSITQVRLCLTIDTPQLAHEGEAWGVFCDFKVWSIFNLTVHAMISVTICGPTSV